MHFHRLDVLYTFVNTCRKSREEHRTSRTYVIQGLSISRTSRDVYTTTRRTDPVRRVWVEEEVDQFPMKFQDKVIVEKVFPRILKGRNVCKNLTLMGTFTDREGDRHFGGLESTNTKQTLIWWSWIVSRTVKRIHLLRITNKLPWSLTT